MLIQNHAHIKQLLSLYRHIHGVIRVVQGLLPAVHEEADPELPRCVTAQRFGDGDEVLERLGHLAASYRQVACVEEVVHPAGLVEVSLGTRQEH